MNLSLFKPFQFLIKILSKLKKKVIKMTAYIVVQFSEFMTSFNLLWYDFKFDWRDLCQKTHKTH